MKILYAINQKNVEDQITKECEDFAVVVGTVIYREAILAAIKNTGADTLLILESLKGTVDFLKLLKNIRIEEPQVRIVCILKEREDRQDPILAGLVALGIYDIINQDSVKISDIKNCLTNPRTFRDVAEYYGGAPSNVISQSVPEEEEESSDKKSIFNLFGQKKKPKKNSETEIIPSVPTPAQNGGIEIETLRVAIQEEADRKAQAKVDQIAREMTKKAVEDLQQKLDASDKRITEILSERKMIEEQGFRAVSELSVTKRDLLAANQELEALRAQSADTISTYEKQIESLAKTDAPNVFSQKMHEWMERENEFQKQIRELQEKVTIAEERAKTSGSVVSPYVGVDVTATDMSQFIMPEDPDDYVAVKNANTHTYLFAGTKHGVGNTTMALNMATSLAQKGYKTLYMEFNSHYPLINEFFEFLSIPRGIDTAVAGLRSGNPVAVDAAIIKPHGITTGKKPLARAYAKLPGALHFMLFTNQYLQSEKTGSNQSFSASDLCSLFQYLASRLGYLYLVIDIQPDDEVGQTIFRQCGSEIDQLVLTCTQDPHSITTAGLMINDLARSQSVDLIKSMKILVNEFGATNDLSVVKIAKWLNLSPKRFFSIPDDRPGFYKAAYSMLPYLISGGKYTSDFLEMAAEL